MDNREDQGGSKEDEEDEGKVKDGLDEKVEDDNDDKETNDDAMDSEDCPEGSEDNVEYYKEDEKYEVREEGGVENNDVKNDDDEVIDAVQEGSNKDGDTKAISTQLDLESKKWRKIF